MALILVVDDYPASRHVLAMLLSERGHRLLEASDGAEALRLTRMEHPDLVIADILMPMMDGYEFVRQLRANPAIAHTPVIFYTAVYHEQEARMLAQSGGVVRLITKPFDLDEMFQTVDAVLGGHALETPTPPSDAFDCQHRLLLTNKLSQNIEELRASEARFRLLVEGIKDYAIVMLDTDGRVVSWNAGAQRISGYEAEEIIGQPCSCWYTVQDCQQGNPAEDLRLAVTQGKCEAEGWRVRKDKSWFWADVVITPVYDETRELRGFAQVTRDSTERRRAEEEHRRRLQLQAFSRQIVEVQEAERRHLARELHDEIGQILTGLLLTLEGVSRRGSRGTKARLHEAQALVMDLLERVQNLSRELRPALLDDLGLLPALQSLFERYSRQTHVHVHFAHSGRERRWTPAVETAAYRIVQEALTNVARHAGVGEVQVRLWTDEKSLGVQIEDQGSGFDPKSTLAMGTASGLSGMRERALASGGDLTVESSPGQGTRIRAAWCLSGSMPFTGG